MSDFHLQVEAAERMARFHDQAAERVAARGPGQPTSIDGGIGGPALMTIVSAIGSDGAKAGAVHAASAAVVRTAVDRFTGFDADAAAAFETLAKGLPGGR